MLLLKFIIFLTIESSCYLIDFDSDFIENEFEKIYLVNKKLYRLNESLKLCDEKNSINLKRTRTLIHKGCILPIRTNFPDSLKKLPNQLLNKTNRRTPRGIGDILGKLSGNAGKGKGGGIFDTLQSLVQNGNQNNDESESSSNDNEQVMALKTKFNMEKEKIDEAFEDKKEKISLNETQAELTDKLNDLQISNDVSYNGYEEFKFGDLKISVSDDNMDDFSGTLTSIEFPQGVGLYIAQECFREMNQPECERLFERSTKSKQLSCGQAMIPSAHVIGTGFLISRDAIDKTRRKSLITRLCNKPIKYGKNLIPDGLSIAEIYDSEAHSVFFTDSEQLVTYLSSSYGVSITNEELKTFSASFGGGIPLYNLNINGNSEVMDKNINSKTSNKDNSQKSQTNKQTLLSLFEINVIRYSLFVENIRPEHIDPFFMIDFMSLPINYFLEDSAIKYEKFLFRYGTHYIHSAEFGGQILFENSRTADAEQNMNELAEKASQEIQNAFGTTGGGGGGGSIPFDFITADLGGNLQHIQTKNSGEKTKNENFMKTSQNHNRNWTNMFLQSQGGDINVAKLITRFESNTGAALTEWLSSIPKYPKAFKIKMRSITELLNFNVRNLFIDELSNRTCEKTSNKQCIYGTTFEEFQHSFDQRRKSLEFAIEIFRNKNSYQFTDLEIEPGTPDTCLLSVYSKSSLFPTYEEILNGTEIKVIMELDDDYSPFYRGEEIYVMLHNNLWFSRKRYEHYNFLRTYKMPISDSYSSLKPIVIRNLIFSYNETSGDLIFKEIGYNLESHSSIVNLKELNNPNKLSLSYWGKNGILQNMITAQVSYVNVLQGIHKAINNRYFIMPCNLDWSSANSRRFSISTKHGKCLTFIASSFGDIFVVFATNPHNEWTWYFIQISSYGVALYRAGLVIKYKLDSSSGSLKDANLFRRFFICMNFESRSLSNSHTTQGLYIQYGIIEGQHSKEEVHLNYFDQNGLEPRYYMFGSYDAKVSIFDIDVKILNKDLEVQLRCSYSNMSLIDETYCKNLCHDNCIGCFKANSPTSCRKCRYDAIYDENKLVCLDTCARGYVKNTFLHVCEDIDECNLNDTIMIYKNKFTNEIYEWTKCASNFSICINRLGSYECKCINGFEGDGFTCNDINECDSENQISNKCPLNSECVNYLGNFECICLNGFQMIDSKCEDVDECKNGKNECQTNSYCQNTIGSYRCLCEKGFKGNGIFCEDINECQLKLDNCWDNSKCLNTIGSFICICNLGFKLENNRCIEIKTDFKFTEIIDTNPFPITQKMPINQLKNKAENYKICNKASYNTLSYCKFKNNCDPNAECIYNSTSHKYICNCFIGYIGNGYKCYDERRYFIKDKQICRTLENKQLICIKFIL